MAQMMNLFEKVITQKATQPVVVNVNLSDQKKKTALSDSEQQTTAPEPGGAPRPYTS